MEDNLQLKLFLEDRNLTEKQYYFNELELEPKYKEFVDNMLSNYYKTSQIDKLDEKEFFDYMAYTVLSEKIEDIAMEQLGVGQMNSSNEAIDLLLKYNITPDNSDPDSLYIKLRDCFDYGTAKKVEKNYKEEVETLIPENFKEKYQKSLSYNKDEQAFDNYYKLSDKIQIAKNLENIENKNSKVKFMVIWSENDHFKENQVLTYNELNDKYQSAKDDLKQKQEKGFTHPGTYNKIKLALIVDEKEKDVKIFTGIRCDIPDYQSIEDCLKIRFGRNFAYDIKNLANDIELNLQEKKACEEILNYLNIDLNSLEENLKHDFLSINKGVTDENLYAYYLDENHEVMCNIDTLELITDTKEIDKIMGYEPKLISPQKNDEEEEM